VQVRILRQLGLMFEILGRLARHLKVAEELEPEEGP
jgi:hypothetical protein